MAIEEGSEEASYVQQTVVGHQTVDVEIADEASGSVWHASILQESAEFLETFPASLPFYLGHPLVLMSVDGATLRSNYILRRHSQMVDDAGPLRSPSWLAGAMADCRTPRLFLVWHQDDPARAQLAATGRPMRAGGRNRFLFGLCPDAPATAR